MRNIKSVIFDLDNTLLHFDHYWDDSVKATFRNYHLTQDLNMDDLFRIYKEHDVIFDKLLEAGEITLDKLRQDRFYETMKAFNIEVSEREYLTFHELLTNTTYNYIQPNEQYNHLLNKLSRRYKLALMTNGTSYFQRLKIKKMNLESYFNNEYIFISDEVGHWKPSSEIYQMAIKTLDVEADEVLFVGDSLRNDVIGPMHFGMKAIWVNKENVKLTENINPTFIIKDVLELTDILEH